MIIHGASDNFVLISEQGLSLYFRIGFDYFPQSHSLINLQLFTFCKEHRSHLRKKQTY